MSTYRPLTSSDEPHPLVDVSIASMRKFYRVEVRCDFIPRADRLAVARIMKWPEEDVTDDLAKDAYIVEMARVLFPTVEVGSGDALCVPEVLRARADFGAALR